MKGSLQQLKDSNGKLVDRYKIQIYTGVTPDGRYIRRFETIKGHKGDAVKRLHELSVNLEKGIPIPSGSLTVAEHLHQWLEGYAKTNCSQRTLEGYQSIVEYHLIPNLGRIKLKQLQPSTIQGYYGKAIEKLSARTVHHIHRVLSQSLKYAVRQGYLGRNPCELVDPPSPRKKAMCTMTPSEVEALLDTAKDNYYYPVIYTAVSTGLRQAELLGLRWRDVDLDMLSISVSQVLYKRGGVCEFKEPKTSRSRRRVAMTPKLALYLKEYKTERKLLYLDKGKQLTLDNLVFASVEGKPLSPWGLSHEFSKIAKKLGLEGVHFHTLRHSFASIMLLRGAKSSVISEALGHASVAFTLDTYAHIIEGMQSEAMALLDEALPAGVNGVKKQINASLTPEADKTPNIN